MIQTPIFDQMVSKYASIGKSYAEMIRPICTVAPATGVRKADVTENVERLCADLTDAFPSKGQQSTEDHEVAQDAVQSPTEGTEGQETKSEIVLDEVELEEKPKVELTSLKSQFRIDLEKTDATRAVMDFADNLMRQLKEAHPNAVWTHPPEFVQNEDGTGTFHFEGFEPKPTSESPDAISVKLLSERNTATPQE